MYVKVRTMDGTQTAVLTISKLTSVKDFRKLVHQKLEVVPSRQRLFFRGKQLEDEYVMFDYNININDVIQLLIKPILGATDDAITKVETPVDDLTKSNESSENKVPVVNTTVDTIAKSDYYYPGDLVDAVYPHDGSWWEARIVKITGQEGAKSDDGNNVDGLVYHTAFEDDIDEGAAKLNLDQIRPRARTNVPLEELSPGQMVMVNYNVEEPKERGYWYDCKVENISNTRTKKSLIATIYIGNNKTPLENCDIVFVNEVFEIEKPIPLSVRNNNDSAPDSPVKRKSAPNCTTCKDNPKRKCKDCGCHECHNKDNPDKQLMCDECDAPFHIYCLDPPLETIPDVEEWFCPLCKNDDTEIVKAGEKLKKSKKSKMPSATTSSKRDWGKGFACAGRQKVCTIVGQNHFGPIPGVEVGTMWKYRVQVSEAGVHRPPVCGIHGRDNEGAFSLALSGGYEDDVDKGEEFFYTGAGGRDLSGNKRTADQSCDQELTRTNKALALNCNVKLNMNGAEAVDWKKGVPVRVIRNCKLRKHSKYAPEEGNRYDGIYKVVKYWPQTGKSGFKVWRYLLRRDDPAPPPWTKEGKKRTEELGLTMQYPDGYLEAENEKAKAANDDSSSQGKNKKRRHSVDNNEENEAKTTPKSKKQKIGYKLENDIQQLIEKDDQNSKSWNDCLTSLIEGKSHFLTVVEERFLCICCQELACKPVTTTCKHNVCQSCLQRSFKAEVYNCPACRHDLGEKYSMDVNQNLYKALLKLFPGYNAAR